MAKQLDTKWGPSLKKQHDADAEPVGSNYGDAEFESFGTAISGTKGLGNAETDGGITGTGALGETGGLEGV